MSKNQVIDPNDPTESEVRCIKCSGRACIHEMKNKWTAHCIDCNYSIGKDGKMDYCCDSPQDAKTTWEFINTPFDEVTPDTDSNEYIEEDRSAKDSMRMVGIILLLAVTVFVCILFGHIGIKG